MAGAAMGTGGSAPVGNSDKTKEKVWFNGDINLASSMTANVSTPANWIAPTNYYDGQILVRLVVTKGVPDLGRLETPFATSEFLLVKEHGVPLAGPVVGKLTMVLVPRGLTFSGWAGYPK